MSLFLRPYIGHIEDLGFQKRSTRGPSNNILLEGHTQNFYIPFPFFKKGVMVEYPLNMSKLVTFTDFEYKDIVIFRPMNMTAQNSKDIFD